MCTCLRKSHCARPFTTGGGTRESVCCVGCRGSSSPSESRTFRVSPPWWRGSAFTGGQQLPGFQQLVPGTPHKLVVRGLENVWRKGWKSPNLRVRGQRSQCGGSEGALSPHHTLIHIVCWWEVKWKYTGSSFSETFVICMKKITKAFDWLELKKITNIQRLGSFKDLFLLVLFKSTLWKFNLN